MGVSADTLRALMAAGLAGDALLSVVESIDRDMREMLAVNGIPVDRTAEKRRAWDRERKAKKTAAKLSAEIPPEKSTGIPPETGGINSSNKEEVLSLSEEEGSEEGSGSAKAPQRKAAERSGHRLPPEWSPTIDQIGFALTEGLTEPEAWRQVEIFRDYWHSQPGAKGRKVDWALTWKNWIRRAAGENKRRRPSAFGADQARSPADQAIAAYHRRDAQLPPDGWAPGRGYADRTGPAPANDGFGRSPARPNGRQAPEDRVADSDLLAGVIPAAIGFRGSH